MDRAHTRRTNTLTVLFLFFLLLTVVCLRSLLDAPATTSPAPEPVVELALISP